MIPEILKRSRHEIGVHGWVHEEPPTIGNAATENELLNRAIDYISQATGKRPVGIRAPSWDFSPDTARLISQAGLLYDTSLMARDETYEVESRGRPTGLIELPINWIADDYIYYDPHANASMPVPSGVYEIYKSEFDGAYREGTLFILTLHPQISGYRGRIGVIDQLVTYIQSKPGVWFRNSEQVAGYVKQQSGLK